MSNTPRKPSIPLPSSTNGADPNSWANDTIVRRWPEILDRIFKENTLPPEVAARLRRLQADIPNGVIREIDDPGAPDVLQWRAYTEPFVGLGWLEPPWFFCEHYLYRRVMAAIGYFQPGVGERLDPFAHQKRQGLIVSRQSVRSLAVKAERWRPAPPARGIVERLLYIDLWGNQADLSLWPADGAEKPDHGALDQAESFLLADDVAAAADQLMSRAGDATRVDLLVDNAGMELATDLIMADYLLSAKVATEARFHLKPYPTYVSDAMIDDVMETIRFFEDDSDGTLRALGARLGGHVNEGRLRLMDNFFWTSPQPAWEMSDRLRRQLAESDLVISKGDAHYRRLLGDLDWPATTPFSAIVSYYPAPILALRTLKSELACGLPEGCAEELSDRDPAWMTGGRYGVAQFSPLEP